jgi:hypothetical protein
MARALLEQPRAWSNAPPEKGPLDMSNVIARLGADPGLPDSMPIATLAQIAPSPPAGSAATPGSASVSLLLLLALAAYLMVKTKGAQWPHVGIGVLIGVVGATTVIGSLSWSVINVLIQLVNQIGSAFG